ncbi:unnamed protein product [Chondrus crispus]|uniref:Uncharacterized protein n=1 Tax=Chondrus crispus TaxID=2769 RepID=R7Q4I7_CHOCR|nr:unnamed protein product [Chondrus crispus]CDF32783.1 unnamed protein product [Chondrus crispus]|eukprot:XP_005712584.1 unnamed protein product [Chondrus crispus]
MSGILIIAGAFTVGVILVLLSYPSAEHAGSGISKLTIDGTRRVLAMSLLTKYNCGLQPRVAPCTVLIQTGECTGHLETSYLEDLEPVPLAALGGESKLVVLGGAPNRPKTSMCGNSNDTAGPRYVNLRTYNWRTRMSTRTPVVEVLGSQGDISSGKKVRTALNMESRERHMKTLGNGQTLTNRKRGRL